ncbi:uncharacterized protein [Triticum aestivum]|uniref:uncharacterized protein n=1 Tax=Triticum aestivum TaxID=4565 RepID=UPI001D01FF3C|nr:uncharacterized protein LOC123160215 [Triticum aestivum]
MDPPRRKRPAVHSHGHKPPPFLSPSRRPSQIQPWCAKQAAVLHFPISMPVEKIGFEPSCSWCLLVDLDQISLQLRPSGCATVSTTGDEERGSLQAPLLLLCGTKRSAVLHLHHAGSSCDGKLGICPGDHSQAATIGPDGAATLYHAPSPLLLLLPRGAREEPLTVPAWSERACNSE